jgi:tetratricopeptide (TPR) repeat protein
LYIIMELPVLLFLLRFPVRSWSEPRLAPAAVAATLLGITMVDCIVNGFVNIIYVSLAGGLINVTVPRLGVDPTRSQRTRWGTGRGSRVLEQSTIGNDSYSRGIPDTHPNINSPGIVNRIAIADRYNRLGHSLKSDERWLDAYCAWDRSFDILTELTRRDPDNLDLKRRWCESGNDLAWLLLNHPVSDERGPDYAVRLASQIVNACADLGMYWNTLGAACVRAGDPRAAIGALERAAALPGGENPFNHVFLAIAHAQLGGLEQAQHSLAQAILLTDRDYPNHPELIRLCDEARAIVENNAVPPPTVL